jgi:hypothetical protein
MWVYDVEVLDVRILDEPVKKLLFDAQRTAIVFEVNRRNEENRLLWEKLKEAVNRQIYEAQASTLEKAVELEASKQALALRQLESSLELDERAKVRRAQIEARRSKRARWRSSPRLAPQRRRRKPSSSDSPWRRASKPSSRRWRRSSRSSWPP